MNTKYEWTTSLWRRQLKEYSDYENTKECLWILIGIMWQAYESFLHFQGLFWGNIASHSERESKSHFQDNRSWLTLSGWLLLKGSLGSSRVVVGLVSVDTDLEAWVNPLAVMVSPDRLLIGWVPDKFDSEL